MTDKRRTDGPLATRREFLKTSAVAAAGTALAANLSLLSNAHAAGSDVIKVGVIGLGGRGSGAADNVLHSAPNVQIEINDPDATGKLSIGVQPVLRRLVVVA